MFGQLLLVIIVPFAFSALLTPLVIRLARRIGAMDLPNERKVHTSPTPRLGGVAIYLSFFLSLVSLLSEETLGISHWPVDPHVAVMVSISLTIVLLIGIWDDVRQLSPLKKLFGQLIAATIVYAAGFRILMIMHPFNSVPLNLGFLDYPITVLWIVGITNAFNLIDGLDGLAAGVGGIIAITIAALSFMRGDVAIAFMAILLAGAVAGFLPFNFHKARIFLGDSGSYVIGFALAILSILSSTKGSAAFSLLVPVLALGVPIIDVVLSMMRRFLKSSLHERLTIRPFMGNIAAMFIPDRGHIHHQLMFLGLSHRKAVLLLYAVSCFFSASAFAISATDGVVATPILIVLTLATFVGINQLRYKEMGALRDGFILPLYQRRMMNSSMFHGFLDLAFILGAYAGASLLTPQVQGARYDGVSPYQILPLVATCQLAVFYFSGLYKTRWHQFGMKSTVNLVVSVIGAVITTWMAVSLLHYRNISLGVTTFILDFYFLISWVLTSRISFHLLNYYSRRSNRTGKRHALIYGAGSQGAVLAQHLINDASLNLSPVGFLDDRPDLEGKRLDGYPILGGHWKLERFAKTMHVNAIILSNEVVQPLILNRLIRTAAAHNITIFKPRIHLENLVERHRRQSNVAVNPTLAVR